MFSTEDIKTAIGATVIARRNAAARLREAGNPRDPFRALPGMEQQFFEAAQSVRSYDLVLNLLEREVKREARKRAGRTAQSAAAFLITAGLIILATLGFAAALLLTMTAGCGDQGGQSGGGSGKLPINSVSLPEKLDGDVIKILGYAGWEAEHEEIRKILKDTYGVTVEYTVLSNWKDNDNKIATELASGNSYDLVISGHAHGGIVRLPFTDGLLGTDRKLFPTWTAGVYTLGDSTLFVSRGLGNNTVPIHGFRLFNRPDLAVLELTGEERA